MNDTLKRLYSGVMGTAQATYYTAPAGSKVIVRQVTICNKTAAAATATLLLNGCNIINGREIPAKDTLVLPLYHVIEATNSIEGLAGTAAALDIYISGIEVI